MAARMQALNKRLADELSDSVSVYSDNGLSYDSVDRDNLINSASRFFYNVMYRSYRLILRRSRGETHTDISRGIDYLTDFIPAPVKLSPSLITALPEDGQDGYCVTISTIHARLKEIFKVLDNQSPKRGYEVIERQDILKVFSGISRYRANNYAPKCWITTKSSVDYLRFYPMASAVDVFITFMEYPNDALTSAGGEDILWRTEFDDTLIKIATGFAFLYNGEPEKFQAIVQACLSIYSVMPEIITEQVRIEENQKAQA